jgi:hypothetical protein
MDCPSMNASTTPRMLPGLVLAVAVAALAAGCNGLQPPTNDDPAAVVLASPDLPRGASSPGDPALPGPASTGPTLPWPGQPVPRDVVIPYPDEVRQMIAAKKALEGDTSLLRMATPSVVYLNFEGGSITYSSNGDDSFYNESFIPGKNVTIPAFNASHWGSNRTSIINTIVADLQQVYAGYNVTFTTTRPSSGNYMMTMIGGSAALIGMEQGVLGVSPMDCSNQWARDVNFICTEDIAAYGMNLMALVYTIAHENAHTYGLAHINRTGDIMYWAEDGSGSLTWGAGTTRSGESNCSTNNYQDDKLFLTQNVGGGGSNPETTPPNVAITSPANGATVGSSFDVTVTATDASGIAKIELYANGALNNSSVVSPATFSLLGMQAGTYQLQAKATDSFGNVGTSATIAVTVPGGQPTGCTSNAQCGTNQTCQSGTCVDNPPAPTGGALGANCSTNDDCTSTWCIHGEQNYCTQACNEAQGIYCPSGYYCSTDGFCLSSTPIPPGATGAPCSANLQCRSQICVDGTNNGYCTAVCQPNGNPCPNGSHCVDSGDGQTYVCDRPLTATHDGGTGENTTSGGCAAAPGASGSALAGLVLALLLGAPRRRRAR